MLANITGMLRSVWQVRTVAYCGRTSACHLHCAFAFSLIGPGSHMCSNVGRSHRHNHVFYILDFAQVTCAVSMAAQCSIVGCQRPVSIINMTHARSFHECMNVDIASV